MTPQQIHEEMETNGFGHARVTERMVEGQIDLCQFYVFPGTTTTVCCLTLQNGFTVIGSSACVHSDNYSREVGERVARADAVRQIWQLCGYQLKNVLQEIGNFQLRKS